MELGQEEQTIGPEPKHINRLGEDDIDILGDALKILHEKHKDPGITYSAKQKASARQILKIYMQNPDVDIILSKRFEEESSGSQLQSLLQASSELFEK